MKKFFLVLLLFLLFVIVGVGVGIFYLIKTFDANKFIEITSREINKSYGYEIKSSDVNWDIKSGLSIDGLIIIDTKKNKDVLTAEKCILSYDITRLLSERKLKISRILFVNAITSYEALTNLFERMKTNPAETPKVNIQLSTISLNNSIIKYNGKNLKLNGDIELKEGLNLKLKGEHKNTKLDFNGNLKKAKVTLKNFNINEWLNVNIPLYIENSSFNFNKKSESYLIYLDKFYGKYNDKNIKIDKQFKMEVISNFKIYEFENVELTYNLSNQLTIEKASFINSKNFSINAKNLNVYVAEFFKDFNGIATGSFYYNGKKINCNLNLQKIRFDNISNFNGNLKIEEDSFLLEGEGFFITYPVNIRLTTDELKNKKINAKLYLKEIALESLTNFKMSGSKGTPLNYNINTEMIIDKISYSNLNFYSLKADINILPQKITFDKINFNAFSGNFSGKGKLEDDILNLTFKFEKGKLNEFSDIFFKDEKKVYGTLSMNGDISLKGFNLSTFEGKIKGNVIYGELENIFIQNQLREFLSDLPLDHVYFDNIDFDLSIKNSKLNFNNFDFKSKKILSKINGFYSFSEKNTSLNISLSVEKSYLNDLPNIANLLLHGKEKNEWVDFFILIEGNLKSPRFSFINQ